MTKKEGIGPNKKENEKPADINNDAKVTEATGLNEPKNGPGDDEVPAKTGEAEATGENETAEHLEAEEKASEEKKEEVEGKESKHGKHSREKELEAKLSEQHDKYLRLSAEFDNYRKRMLKERIELTQYVSADIYTKMLPVIDDFERAMATIRQTDAMDAVREGVELIYTKFKEHLNQQGIKEIEALNQEFNTDFHDAVTKFPVENKSLKGKVIDVVEKGYILNDKVIRFCKVVVGE